MYSVKFWFDILYIIDGLKEEKEEQLDSKQFKHLDELAAKIYTKIRMGNENQNEHDGILREILIFIKENGLE